jgi:hypothetical protein
MKTNPKLARDLLARDRLLIRSLIKNRKSKINNVKNSLFQSNSKAFKEKFLHKLLSTPLYYDTPVR